MLRVLVLQRQAEQAGHVASEAESAADKKWKQVRKAKEELQSAEHRKDAALIATTAERVASLQVAAEAAEDVASELRMQAEEAEAEATAFAADLEEEEARVAEDFAEKQARDVELARVALAEAQGKRAAARTFAEVESAEAALKEAEQVMRREQAEAEEAATAARRERQEAEEARKVATREATEAKEAREARVGKMHPVKV